MIILPSKCKLLMLNDETSRKLTDPNRKEHTLRMLFIRVEQIYKYPVANENAPGIVSRVELRPLFHDVVRRGGSHRFLSQGGSSFP